MTNVEAMDSATEIKQQPGTIFTKEIVAGIPVLVQQGLSVETIAARLGCTVGTLRVRCSQAQISLRVPKEVKVVPLVPAPKPPMKRLMALPCRPHCNSVELPFFFLSRLRQHAGSHRRERSPACQ